MYLLIVDMNLFIIFFLIFKFIINYIIYKKKINFYLQLHYEYILQKNYCLDRCLI